MFSNTYRLSIRCLQAPANTQFLASRRKNLKKTKQSLDEALAVELARDESYLQLSQEGQWITVVFLLDQIFQQ